jgi:hypothetical protein
VTRLVAVPALLALAVTLLRLTGELRGFSPTLFGREAGGLGALVGIVWLAPLVGIYLAHAVAREEPRAVEPRRLLAHAAGGVLMFAAFGLAVSLLWPPYKVQVVAGAATAAVIVALQIRGWPAFGRALLLYALASRLPVSVVMFFAIRGSWGTHYDAFPPGFPLTDPLAKWIWGGVVVQLTVWVGITVLLGAITGSVTVALACRRSLRRSRTD